MVKSEKCPVQGDALHAAAVGERLAVERAIVNAFAAQGCAGFAEIDRT